MGGGIQVQNERKLDFELCVGGRGQDMYQQLDGGLGPWTQCCPREALEQKVGKITEF